MDQRLIRNFSIIAHIDHGKSTLADRFLELTGRLAAARDARPRCSTRWTSSASAGITIKAHPVRLYLRREGRADVRPQPDRHAGTRGLLLRGDPVAGRLRGRGAAGRRLAGRRGADAGQRVPGRRQQPRDHPGHQQDRSARRAARGGAPPDRGHHRPRRQSTPSSPARRRAPASRDVLEAIVARLPPSRRATRRPRSRRSSSTRGTTRTAAS